MQRFRGSSQEKIADGFSRIRVETRIAIDNPPALVV